jgi:hypothetical protein
LTGPIFWPPLSNPTAKKADGLSAATAYVEALSAMSVESLRIATESGFWAVVVNKACEPVRLIGLFTRTTYAPVLSPATNLALAVPSVATGTEYV